MSNKTELQANNVELQEILDSVNALPDAGSGGGSVETCNLLVYGASGMGQAMVPYVNSSGGLSWLISYEEIFSYSDYDSSTNAATFILPKDAVIMKSGGEITSIVVGSENIENITGSMNIDWVTSGELQFYRITGDVELTW